MNCWRCGLGLVHPLRPPTATNPETKTHLRSKQRCRTIISATVTAGVGALGDPLRTGGGEAAFWRSTFSRQLTVVTCYDRTSYTALSFISCSVLAARCPWARSSGGEPENKAALSSVFSVHGRIVFVWTANVRNYNNQKTPPCFSGAMEPWGQSCCWAN